MSLLTPENIPVKVYRWDDAGAPVLSKAAGCMAAIFKACLVTGYGVKEGAGWTMPFEGASAGVSVFCPPDSPIADYFLRCSADTGQEMAAQVYLDMTDANTGDMKLQCDTPFKYGFSGISTAWVLIATSVGLWFFTEGVSSKPPVNKRGIYFYCTLTPSTAPLASAIALQHTGGTWGIGDPDRFPITSKEKVGNNYARVLASNVVYGALPSALYDGVSNITKSPVITQLAFNIGGELFFLPAYGSSRNDTVNKAVVQDNNGRDLMCHSTALREDNNIYVPTDYWVM